MPGGASGLGGAAGEAVYEDVDEQLEAFVGVGEGELVGQGGQSMGRGPSAAAVPSSTPVSSMVKPLTVAINSK
jgi:hypothetical protein